VRRALKKVLSLLLGPYRFNRIYLSASTELAPAMPPGTHCRPLEGPPPRALDPNLRQRFSYAAGHDAYGYGLFVGADLAAICLFWGPCRFNDPLLWVLAKDEAILVDLVTAPSCRGQGLAPLLIRYASAEMRRAGWGQLYACVWHSNHASCQAFDKAGWTEIGWVLEIYPFGVARPFRFCWKTARKRAAESEARLPSLGSFPQPGARD
jgi:GNAT superfamily N-acetyltransferase